MKQYRYYSIRDHKKETVGLLSAHNFDNAVKLASERKALTQEQFLSIFALERITNETNNIQ